MGIPKLLQCGYSSICRIHRPIYWCFLRKKADRLIGLPNRSLSACTRGQPFASSSNAEFEQWTSLFIDRCCSPEFLMDVSNFHMAFHDAFAHSVRKKVPHSLNGFIILISTPQCATIIDDYAQFWMQSRMCEIVLCACQYKKKGSYRDNRTSHLSHVPT